MQKLIQTMLLQAKLNPNVVGKPAEWIAEQAGFKVPAETQIICAECKEVGPNEPLTRENYLQY